MSDSQSTTMAFLDIFKFGTGPWDPTNRFQTSWLLTPWVFFTCRAAIAMYTFTAIFFDLAWTCMHEDLGGCRTARRSFSYFTVLSFWGIACYFTVAAVHTLSYILSAGGRRHATLLARLPRPLQALHALFQTSVLTLPLLVTCIFWVNIYDNGAGGGRPWFPSAFTAWRDISGHVLNSVFALAELVVSRVDRPPVVHFLWVVVILFAYLGLAFVTFATQGFYTYKFLDHDEVGGRLNVAALIFVVGLGITGLFMLVHSMIWIRVWVTETKLGMNGKFVTVRGRWGRELELGTLQRRRKDSRLNVYHVL